MDKNSKNRTHTYIQLQFNLNQCTFIRKCTFKKTAYTHEIHTLRLTWKIISEKTMITMRVTNYSLVDFFVFTRSTVLYSSIRQQLHFKPDIIDKKRIAINAVWHNRFDPNDKSRKRWPILSPVRIAIHYPRVRLLFRYNKRHCPIVQRVTNPINSKLDDDFDTRGPPKID